ncbi:MAG: hypothetical protein KC619_07345 [Myxococcales bacterium]|nr:hypothetical protein [Myxococcales bacterium]
MTRSIRILGALLLVLASGCAAEVTRLDNPTLDAELATQGLHQVSRAEWEAAPAGCEDAPLWQLHLAGCEGEPTLGALLDDDGEVICVDALGMLREELAAAPTGPLTADPSPQPSYPGAITVREARPIQGTVPTATHEDPTPTPVVQADDPTPTPVTNPDVLFFQGLPMVERMPDEEDPTPTPTTED